MLGHQFLEGSALADHVYQPAMVRQQVVNHLHHAIIVAPFDSATCGPCAESSPQLKTVQHLII